jgi:argininosuccinate lyase
VPFREAYKQVGLDIERGSFAPGKEVKHTHEGSIGNPGNEEVSRMMKEVIAGFPFEKVDKAIEKLVS